MLEQNFLEGSRLCSSPCSEAMVGVMVDNGQLEPEVENPQHGIT